MSENAITYLHRFSFKKALKEEYLPIFREEVRVRASHGFQTKFAYLDLSGDTKISWCYSYDGDAEQTEKELEADPAWRAVQEAKAPYVYANDVTRQVIPVLPFICSTEEHTQGWTTIFRRYYIKRGTWDGFLETWRKIVPLREKYGFHCAFALMDQEESIFTWGFRYKGAYSDFDSLQKPYYADPDREAQSTVINYMADFKISNSVDIIIP